MSVNIVRPFTRRRMQIRSRTSAALAMSIMGELGGQFVAPRTWYGNIYLTAYGDSHRITERVRQANKRVSVSRKVRQKPREGLCSR